MSSTIAKLDRLEVKSSGAVAERIIAQLNFATRLSQVNDGKFDALITDAVNFLDERFTRDGTLTNDAATQAEKMILSLSEIAKSYTILCAAHAHIDMNWMWGYDQTVAVTLDTFRTMLNLMKEYPAFTFSQSQASVYRIVQEHDPEMLEEIKVRVKEGRWEVTASTWVETDKNMPNGESLARHILYTKGYLSKLLDINPDSLNIDFEPDTFGHNINVPEILCNGGVKYYYHCRGNDTEYLYRWQSPSGKSILVHRDPFWYNGIIDENIASHLPAFCDEYGMKTALKVYGVGNHGGGATRRDIERLMELNTWPVFPTVRFGTFGQYFSELEKVKEKLPLVDRELNFVFTGCYTSQSRIKLANRVSEAKMNEAESFSAVSTAFAGGNYPGLGYKEAWKRVLFNHFHDIFPGSGVIETREFAMGQFQQILAVANTGISQAIRNIASQIDTSSLLELGEDNKDSYSEGGGVGYAVRDFGVSQPERGKGKNRVLHFFNPSDRTRKEPTEVTIFDWPGDKSRIEICDGEGNPVRYQILDIHRHSEFENRNYWGHQYMRLLIDAEVPALGYSTYFLKEKELTDIPVQFPKDPRVNKAKKYTLENSRMKVVFDTQNAAIISLKDKVTGKELVDPQRPSAMFRLIDEDDAEGMTSWRVGRYMNINPLNRDVKMKEVLAGKDALKQWLSYSIPFRSSTLDVTITLSHDSSKLDFDVECDWRETSQIGKPMPQLNFYMPFAYDCEHYKYDIPFGTITREGMDSDVPANSWGLALPKGESNSAFMIVTGSKYGFRGFENALAVDLIRSSYDPDPLPEVAVHRFGFAVMVENPAQTNAALIQKAFDYNHPFTYLSGTKHEGTLELSNGFLYQENETVAVSAVKLAEDDSGRLILRVYECEGEDTQAVFELDKVIKKAYFVDINENPVPSKQSIQTVGNQLLFGVEAFSMASVCLEF
ncbi:MAG: alpha-mannosidase [Clostridiales bacterium]|nr:alpha-mannosidase [Clostridiales bacterium]